MSDAYQTNRLRPVYVMCEDGVPEEHLQAVLDATNAVLHHAGMDRHIEVHNFGVWRHSGWLQDGNHLTAWNSVDWYIWNAQQASRNDHQLHGGRLINLLYNEPWQEVKPHYDIVVVKSDIYDDGCRFVIGLAAHGLGTVISTNRFLGLDADVTRECIITETMHEVGHVFGLVPATRTENVEESLGLHCTNKCIMRQGLRVPHDWLRITDDRLTGHEFCSTCADDLRQFFA